MCQQKRDSPDTASSFALITSELQRKDKFMRVLFSCNVRKVRRLRVQISAAWLWIATSPRRCVDEVTNAELCVCQINRFHKSEDRAVLITDRHLYKLDPLKQYKPMKTLPLYNVGYFICLTV